MIWRNKCPKCDSTNFELVEKADWCAEFDCYEYDFATIRCSNCHYDTDISFEAGNKKMNSEELDTCELVK